MGQQQLLLLVLGVVLVGIAIVVGVNAYSENSVRTNWDNMLQDAMRIANDSQQWKAKPELFGGSPDATKPDADDFSETDFLALAYAPDLLSGGNLCYTNLNGVYELGAAATGLTITGYNVANQNQVEILVTGNLESNIAFDNTDADNVRGGVQVDTGTETAVTAPACPAPGA